MKKIFLIIALASLAALGKSQTINEGIRQMENENFAAALTTFNAVAKVDPRSCLAFFYIGEVNYLKENYAEAEKSYKKGLMANSSCAESNIGLGKLELDKGNNVEAEKYFTSALKSNKKNAALPALVGDAYLYSQKPNATKAIQYLSQARDMDPRVADYWAHLGDAYKMDGNNGEAMTAYETAVEKDSTNAEAYISMARIWAYAKRTELAIPKLEKAMKLSPNDARPIKDLYELYIQTHNYEKVTPLLEKYVALTGTDVDAKVRLVKFLTFQAKDYERAVIEGEKILITNPEEYTLHRWLAWAHFELGHYQESYDHSGKLFDAIGKKQDRKAFPSDYEYWAKAAFQLGKLEDASHIYRKYLELVPERSYEVYGLLAKTYYDSANYEQAIAYEKRKGELKPFTNADEFYLGFSYFHLDQNLEADSSFAKLLELTPNYALAWLMRARISNRIDSTHTEFRAKPFYEQYIPLAEEDKEKNKINLIEAYNYLAYYSVQQDDNQKAKEYYQKILDLDPANESAEESLKILKKQK